MGVKTGFDEVFENLKSIFKPYATRMDVAHDDETYYHLNTKHIMKNDQPLYFGGVKIGKSYVSYHLMPVYVCPELLQSISPELKKRMQGKSCFNFKEIDKKLFAELKRLTKDGAAKFSDEQLIAKLRIMQSGKERRAAKQRS